MPSIWVQPVARLDRGQVAEELERVVAALLADPAQGRLEPRRLLVGQAARPDDVGQLGEWRELDPRPVRRRPSGSPNPPQPAPGFAPRRARARIRAAERFERAFGVRVGAVLGQDREDQLARRVEAALPGRAARSVEARPSSTNGTSPGRYRSSRFA